MLIIVIRKARNLMAVTQLGSARKVDVVVVSSKFNSKTMRPSCQSCKMLKSKWTLDQGRKIIRTVVMNVCIKDDEKLELKMRCLVRIGYFENPYLIFFRDPEMWSRSTRPNMERVFNSQKNGRFIHVQDELWWENNSGPKEWSNFPCSILTNLFVIVTSSQGK